MRVVVTGAAGFIGSHLCEALLDDGHEVTGLGWLQPPGNIRRALAHPKFCFVPATIHRDYLGVALKDMDAVLHLAARAGTAPSWKQFEDYVQCNVVATQRLLDACCGMAPMPQFVYASSSSVYGSNAVRSEAEATFEPVSPYGVTKLAAEHLCWAYAKAHGLPLTILRLFSVYGPRQRDDMAFTIFMRRLARTQPIEVYGDGFQRRSFTFVSDAVDAFRRCLADPVAARGQAFNVGGGGEISLNDALVLLGDVAGREVTVEHGPQRVGDQQQTAANIGKARRLLGYAPKVGLREGLAAQWEWVMETEGAKCN